MATMPRSCNRRALPALLLVLPLVVTACTGARAEARPGEMVLWYDRPAEDVWLDGLFIGNGYMGGNVFGRVHHERIALNESTFWSGRPHDYNDPNAYRYFEQIKALVFAGRIKEAEKLVNQHFYGIPVAQQAYQPLGDLLLDFAETGDPITGYQRELDMATGVASVSYMSGDVRMSREVFMSYPDRVMVLRVSADAPGHVSVEARLGSHFTRQTVAKDNTLTLTGTWKYVPDRESWLIARVDETGMDFQTSLVALPDGGHLETTDSSLVIRGADAVTFLLTAATSFVNYKDIGGNPAAACERVLARVRGRDFDELKRVHLQDFGELMGRVHLAVGDPARNDRPTNERVAALKEGQADPDLLAKIFQFGRYLLVSSSRPGSEPANLQGRWNEELLPNWGSKYTVNINTEMNYWPAEVTNLSETHIPLFHMLEDLAANGAITAQTYYRAGGWVLHHNTDLWRGTAPVDSARFGMWPMGGSWLSLHIWEHYLYTGDADFLEKYYPIMRGSARFLLDVMAVEPRHGWLVVPFSMSPEQGYFVDESGVEQFLASSTTMDVGIIKDLFAACIEAARILGLDPGFRAELARALERIPPYQIGKDGLLQVWIEDWKRGNEGHNMSANFGFFPGHSITPRGNPEIAAAIRKWLEPRQARTGWPSAWDICDWARLEDGGKVDTVMRDFFRLPTPPQGVQRPGAQVAGNAARPPMPMAQRGIGNNLHNTSSNQSDANFGFTACVAEALLQSHAGEVSLLPALPVGWRSGSVEGLRARGGFEVDITWKDGALLESRIESVLGKPFTVRYGDATRSYELAAGQSIRLTAGDFRGP